MKPDRRRSSLLGACVLVVALAVPAGALAGAQLQVRTAKKASGPYTQHTRLKIPDGEAKSGYVRVKSKLDKKVGATLSYELVAFSGPEYSFDWFKGKKKITADVNDDGYDFGLRPGKSKLFRMRIKAPTDAEHICVSANTDIGGNFAGNAYFGVNGTCD
jgi:hypothetical protein